MAELTTTTTTATATTPTTAAPAATTNPSTPPAKAASSTLNESSSFETRDELDHDPTGHPPSRSTRILESVRLGLIVLGLLLGITIFSTAADAVAVFNKTHVDAEFSLALWPFDFNLGPNIGYATAGALIAFWGFVGIVVGRVAFLRIRLPLLTTLLTLTGPFLSLTAAVSATAYYYTNSHSSSSTNLQAWTCQWSDIGLDSEPHFGKLCKEGKVGVYLTIVEIPVQVAVLAVSGLVVLAERKRGVWLKGVGHGRWGGIGEREKGSPALS